MKKSDRPIHPAFVAAARELLLELYRVTGAAVATRDPERPDDEEAVINIIATTLEATHNAGYDAGVTDSA